MVTPGWDPTQQGTPAGASQVGYGPPPALPPQEHPGQVGPAVTPAPAPAAGGMGGPVPQQYPMQPNGMPVGQPSPGYGQPAYGAPVPPQPYGPGGPGGPVGPVGHGQPPYPPPPGFGRKSGNKGLLIGVCSVLAAALVGGGVYLALAGDGEDEPSSADSGGSGGTTTTQQTATPEAAATVFLDALTKHDVSTAAKFACEEFRQDVLAVKPDDGVTFSYRILGTEKISDSMTHVRVNERFEKDGTVQEDGDQILVLVKEDGGYRVCGEQQPELSGG